MIAKMPVAMTAAAAYVIRRVRRASLATASGFFFGSVLAAFLVAASAGVGAVGCTATTGLGGTG